MTSSEQKCEFSVLKCGKLRGKCAKPRIFLGGKWWVFDFSTLWPCGKVEKQSSNYTNAKNRSVEKNNFSHLCLTRIIQKKRFYSPFKKIFLCTLHKKSRLLQEYQGSKACKDNWQYDVLKMNFQCGVNVYVLVKAAWQNQHFYSGHFNHYYHQNKHLNNIEQILLVIHFLSFRFSLILQ